MSVVSSIVAISVSTMWIVLQLGCTSWEPKSTPQREVSQTQEPSVVPNSPRPTTLGRINQITSRFTERMPQIPPSVRDSEDALYRQLHPYFMDGCVAGQRVDRAGTRGNLLGHGGLFLRGACLDPSVNYPKLKTDCRPGEDEIGVSTNGQFTNMNWVGIPTERLFFYGNVSPNEVFNQDRKDQMVREIVAMNLYEGINSVDTNNDRKPFSGPESQRRYSEVAAAVTIDYGLALARQTVCTRSPLTREQLEAVVEFLNDRNEHYFLGGRTYTWDLLANSCAHTYQNAFAAAGIAKEKKTVDEDHILSKLGSIIVPSNSFINIARGIVVKNFWTLKDVVEDSRRANTLRRFGIVGTRPGVLTRYLPLHGINDSRLNEIYDPAASGLGFFDFGFFDQLDQVAKNLLQQPENYDIEQNLVAFISRYEKELKKVDVPANRVLRLKVRLNINPYLDVSNETFKELHGLYVQALRSTLTQAKADLQKVRSMKAE